MDLRKVPGYELAERLRKQGRCGEVAPTFDRIWSETRSPDAGWRRAFCRRKEGHPAEAAEIAREVLAIHPGDPWTLNELFWSLRDCAVAPEGMAKQAARRTLPAGFSIDEFTGTAEAVAAAFDDDGQRARMVFATIDVLKAAGRWEEVAAWCDRLNRASVSIAPREVDGRKLLSDLERWYYAKLRALLELKRWEDLRLLAQEASAKFPWRVDFPRWAALALAETGDPAAALTEIAPFAESPSAPWYLLHDAATWALAAGHADSAWQLAARGALTRGEDRLKVNLFAFMAEVELARGEVDSAASHLDLATAIRMREGWGQPTTLQTLRDRIESEMASAGLPLRDAIENPETLIRSLVPLWQRTAGAAREPSRRPTTEPENGRKTGVLARIHANGKSGHIRPDGGGDDVFVVHTDVSPDAWKPGVKLEFVEEPSFDRKRNRPSVRAVGVRTVERDGGSGRAE